MPLKMGVIGVGYLGLHHARIYSEIENADLVAIADTDSAKAADVVLLIFAFVALFVAPIVAMVWGARTAVLEEELVDLTKTSQEEKKK